jgi:hypothetical protein
MSSNIIMQTSTAMQQPALLHLYREGSRPWGEMITGPDGIL